LRERADDRWPSLGAKAPPLRRSAGGLPTAAYFLIFC
jgi:hypothetical protein